MQTITPFLWFNDNAEEAVAFYTSVFKPAEVLETTYYNEASARVSGRARGSVMSIEFTLREQLFTALNGGPVFTFSPATSFVVSCETQAEIDYYWERLSEGGSTDPCGWLKDRFGVTWQIVPTVLTEMLREGGPAQGERVTEAMLTMSKLDIADLKQAYRQD